MQVPDLLRELKRTVDELGMLNQIGKALTSSLDIGEVIHLILAKVSELLKPRNWSVLLHDAATGELYFKASVGPGSELLAGLRVRPGEGIAGWVAAHNQAARVDDVASDARFAARFDQVTQFHTRAILAVPLSSKGKTLGVIELVNGEGDGVFTDEDLRILSTVAEFAAIAIENAQNFQKAQELTVIDDHTGLFNSRHLKRILDQEVVRATRFGHPVSLVFLDLDHFKEVNDQYGHQVGSALLREVGLLLRKVLRSTDVPVRYGGDEFVMLLPETGKDQAMECAGRLRDAMRAARFFADEPFGPITSSASFGVATFPDDARTAENLLVRADQAMYRVKASARGEVAGARPTRSQPELAAVGAAVAAAKSRPGLAARAGAGVRELAEPSKAPPGEGSAGEAGAAGPGRGTGAGEGS